jgi:hypothetical protein
MRNISKSLPIFFLIGLSLPSCKTNNLFQARKYYGSGGVIWEFHADNSYQYLEKMEGGYVYKFSKGTWTQDGNKLFLVNEVLRPTELPTIIKKITSNESGIQVVINIFSKKNLHFAYLPSTTDLFSIELVIDKVAYSLKNETNIIRLQKPFDNAYLIAYPKPGVEKTSEMLSDTLRSNDVLYKELGSVVTIDVDCNPYYFAQVKMTNDTLRIINDHKIKWNKVYFERPR